MALVHLSADVDLSLDPFAIHLDNDGDWCTCVVPGSPSGQPGTESAPFAVRMMSVDNGSFFEGYEVFESRNGVWNRGFTRQYNGSCSFAAWVKVTNFNSQVVTSVNSATGEVTISVSGT